MAGARTIDWEDFLQRNDGRYRLIVKEIAAGRKLGETAKASRVTTARLRLLILSLAADVLEQMGEQVLDDVIHAPAWKGNLRVKSERAACMADRRRG